MSANSEYLAVVARGHEVEVAGTAESLKYLADLLQSLRDRKVVLDHEHLIAPGWGGSDLADISESADEHSFPMVTLRRVEAVPLGHFSLSTEKRGLELEIEADDSGLYEMERAIRGLLSARRSVEGQRSLIWQRSDTHMGDEHSLTALAIKLLTKQVTGL
jgi:hypothetical protein